MASVEITTVERVGTILGILPQEAIYQTIQGVLDALSPDSLETVRDGCTAYWKIKFKTTVIEADGAKIDPAKTRDLIARTIAQVTGLPNQSLVSGGSGLFTGVTETQSDVPRILEGDPYNLSGFLG